MTKEMNLQLAPGMNARDAEWNLISIGPITSDTVHFNILKDGNWIQALMPLTAVMTTFVKIWSGDEPVSSDIHLATWWDSIAPKWANFAAWSINTGFCFYNKTPSFSRKWNGYTWLVGEDNTHCRLMGPIAPIIYSRMPSRVYLRPITNEVQEDV